MPPPSRFKSGGGKKGPRQATSKRQPKIILRPAPAPSRPADTSSKGRATGDDGADDGEEEDEARYGYREALQGEERPLEGLKVTVSGCSGKKEDLLNLAEEYGAERHNGLQLDTTHVVTDKPAGQKYETALAHRMHVMLPSWLEAVRETWMSGGSGFDEIEYEHQMPPLYGVTVCFTHFAHGNHKNDMKRLVTSSGAEYSEKLTSSVTHLVVASPSSPHSPTQPSDKIKHALSSKSASSLNAELVVVWEGWAHEAIKYGGMRAERTRAWQYNQSRREPPEDLEWKRQEVARRTRATLRESDIAHYSTTPAATPFGAAPSQSRSLVPANTPGTARPHAFRGYDSTLTNELAPDGPASTSTVVSATKDGKVLKKRRRAGPSTTDLHPSASRAVRADEASSLLEAYGASQQPAELSRFADADVTLPSLDVAMAYISRADPPPPPEEEENAEMALELVPGEVEMQYTKKSKSTIKAVSAGRDGSFAPDDGSGDKKTRRTLEPAVRRGAAAAEAEKAAGANEDSAFFDGPPPLDDGPAQATTVQPSSGSRSSESDEGPLKQIFEGKTFALMALRQVKPGALQSTIEGRGGKVVVDASDEELAMVDFVLVDFDKAPKRFVNSEDNRIVTICWLELCIYCDDCLPPQDRLLERPLPYSCPVPTLDTMRLHFSGYGHEEDVAMHHNRRFASLIGASSSPNLDKSCTHLIIATLDENPSLSPDDLDSSTNPKVALARRLGKEICSLRHLRDKVSELAAELAKVKAGGLGGGKAKGKARERSVREITNELDEKQVAMEQASFRGPLSDCVVFISPKISVDRQHLATIVQDLGGVAAQAYNASVTHFVHHGPKSSESFKDFKQAKKDGATIVHPRWVEECGRTSSHASEGDFPHTFDGRKGGQLFDMGMSVNPASPPPGSPAMSRQVSADGAAGSPRTGMSRSPSKLSFGKAAGSPSPRASPSLDRQQERTKKQPLELAEQERERLPASSSPRRRRSDTTATEIVETAADGDLGGFDGHDAFPSPAPRAEHLQHVDTTASSSPLRQAVPSAPRADAADISSDPCELPPLRSEARPSPGPADDPDRNQLRQQTSLLLAQLIDTPQQEKLGRTKSKTTLNRKRSSGTTSLNTSTRLSPLPDAPAIGAAGASSRRFPGMAYGFEPTQATQDDESMFVVYDNPTEAAAREQIRLALASEGGAPTAEQYTDGVSARTRRSTRAVGPRR
ncbi:hypothetical protein JCM10207_000471 [Rhodosporidiobolus poonsookiae]